MNKYYINYYAKNRWIKVTLFRETDEEAILEYRTKAKNYKSNHYLERLVDGHRLIIDSYDKELKAMYSNWNGGK